MPEPERPLGLIVRVGEETASFGAMPAERQERWWREDLPRALTSVETAHARLMGIWRTTWASDWHYLIAWEFRDLAALEAASEMLGSAGFWRNLRTARLLGRRWGGEAGWDADKWPAGQTHAPLGGMMVYRISESLYTLTAEDITKRHGERRRILDAAVAGVLASGGQRLGSYFCEWSSEWHLAVLYEFADLHALETFNLALPERHGYIDYDLLYVVGRRLGGVSEISRP